MELHSYLSGSGGPPLRVLTVAGVLDSAAEQWPDKDALVVVDQGIRWSWSELRDRSRALAAGLLAAGLNPGDRVGMLASNRAEWLMAQFGTAYAGLILVNINPAYRMPELEYALNKVGCRGLITETQFKTSDYVGMLQTLAPELKTATPGDLHAKRLPELRLIVHLGEGWTPGMHRLTGAAKDVFQYGDVNHAAVSATGDAILASNFRGQYIGRQCIVVNHVLTKCF